MAFHSVSDRAEVSNVVTGPASAADAGDNAVMEACIKKIMDSDGRLDRCITASASLPCLQLTPCHSCEATT